jgi:hypothetical protein|nr:MAG TPA: hypothetical protein [Caudoviricetes sp.]
MVSKIDHRPQATKKILKERKEEFDYDKHKQNDKKRLF